MDVEMLAVFGWPQSPPIGCLSRDRDAQFNAWLNAPLSAAYLLAMRPRTIKAVPKRSISVHGLFEPLSDGLCIGTSWKVNAGREYIEGRRGWRISIGLPESEFPIRLHRERCQRIPRTERPLKPSLDHVESLIVSHDTRIAPSRFRSLSSAGHGAGACSRQ